jgi:hypothetical protein
MKQLSNLCLVFGAIYVKKCEAMRKVITDAVRRQSREIPISELAFMAVFRYWNIISGINKNCTIQFGKFDTKKWDFFKMYSFNISLRHEWWVFTKFAFIFSIIQNNYKTFTIVKTPPQGSSYGDLNPLAVKGLVVVVVVHGHKLLRAMPVEATYW